MTLPDIVNGRYAGSEAISIGTVHTALTYIKKYCEATFDISCASAGLRSAWKLFRWTINVWGL